MVTVLFLLSSCGMWINTSWYGSLDAARNEREYSRYYKDDVTIYTKEVEGGYIDFIFNEDIMRNVCIVQKDGKNLFKVQSSPSCSLSERIQIFNSKQDYYYYNSIKGEVLKYSWCIVTKEFNESHENLDAYEFEYNNQLYHLCVKG